MKIAIDARGLKSSTGRYVRNLLDNLQKLDKHNDYHIILLEDDSVAWKPVNKNFQVHTVKWGHYSFGEQLGYAKFLKNLDADLVHFWMPQQPLLYRGKTVTTVHDLTLIHHQNLDMNKLVYTIKQRIFAYLLKKVARRSELVITPSNYSKHDLIQFAGIDENKVAITYESADKMDNGKEKAILELKKKEFILAVGNAYPYKNLGRLIDSFIIIKKQKPDVHLVLAGKIDFFYEQLMARVEKEDISNVHFLGFVSDHELTWLYNHASVYAFPSLSEGFGLPGLEAMQHKLPVAAAIKTSLPEVYGFAARYFDPNDPVDMARTISRVMNDDETRHELINNGQELLKKYSWKRMAEQTLEVYINALEYII